MKQRVVVLYERTLTNLPIDVPFLISSGKILNAKKYVECIPPDIMIEDNTYLYNKGIFADKKSNSIKVFFKENTFLMIFGVNGIIFIC
jgi:hypothetical protein